MKFDNGLTPIHIDESVVSLSAILLNDVYYDLLISGKEIVDGYSVIDLETAILFKVKAWLDMKERLDRNEHVDSKNVKKHKNDIFRLHANVDPSVKVEVDEEIEKDIRLFVERINHDTPDLKNLGIKEPGFEEIIEILTSIYLEK